MIVQYGLKRSHELPEVPTFMELATSDVQRQTVKFMVARLEYGKPYFAPAGMPADRLEILRRAFDATVKDPEFVKEIKTAQLDVDEPLTGEELAALVAEQAATPRPIIDRIVSIFGTGAQ